VPDVGNAGERSVRTGKRTQRRGVSGCLEFASFGMLDILN
jgi:hypothetical protein